MTPTEATKLVRGLSLRRQRLLNDLVPSVRAAAVVLQDLGQTTTAAALREKLMELDGIEKQIIEHIEANKHAVFSALTEAEQ